MDELTLTFNSPLTEEDWDVLEDVDFDRTNSVWFHTKHGKDVEFVKAVRCGECRWWDQKEGSRYGYCYACRHNFFSPNWEISILRTYREDFFCADGERKDGEQGAVD